MISFQNMLFTTLLLCSCSKTGHLLEGGSTPEPAGENNIAYKWGKISLECTANDTENFRPRPTVTSRMLGLVWISIFDAWSRYDAAATPLFLTSVERRPEDERTLRNKEIAVSYAAYTALR